jgi:hypothetical protein
MASFIERNNTMRNVINSLLAATLTLLETLASIAGSLIIVIALAAVAATIDIANKETIPTAASIAGYDEAGVAGKAALQIVVTASGWNSRHYLFFRYASNGSSQRDLQLVQLPFTGGRWYKL